MSALLFQSSKRESRPPEGCDSDERSKAISMDMDHDLIHVKTHHGNSVFVHWTQTCTTFT